MPAVEVAYARPDRQRVVALDLAAGATLREAVERSGLLQEFPELAAAALEVGVFGRLRRLDEIVSDGDRVEIYRPLLADPKTQRRRRAAARR